MSNKSSRYPEYGRLLPEEGRSYRLGLVISSLFSILFALPYLVAVYLGFIILDSFPPVNGFFMLSVGFFGLAVIIVRVAALFQARAAIVDDDVHVRMVVRARRVSTCCNVVLIAVAVSVLFAGYLLGMLVAFVGTLVIWPGIAGFTDRLIPTKVIRLASHGAHNRGGRQPVAPGQPPTTPR